MTPVLFKKSHHDAIIPTRATDGSAGFDLYALENYQILAGSHLLIPSGIEMAIPPGYCGMIWPRSGLAVKYGIDRLAGLVDSDYRGMVHVSLINHGYSVLHVRKGERIAQIVFTQYLADAEEVDALPDPGTRWGGFGSTGL